MNQMKIRTGIRAGMNNPASQNCEDVGGQWASLNIPSCGGEIGLCVFPSGKVCEEWDLMAGRCTPDMPLVQ